MSGTRKQISTRIRFEIFKRDGFVCQYCGSAPPNVVLHVDHIVPVADGGGNDPDNLATSCDCCNFGKGAVSLSSVPQSLQDKSAEVAEREAQLRGYHEIMESKRQREEDEKWRVAELLEPGCSEGGFRRDYLASIKRFIDRLGLYSVLDAAELSAAAMRYASKRRFLYFCRVCWNRIKEQDEEAQQ